MAIATQNDSTVDTYTFYVYLAGVSELTEDLENRIFEAGCDDALLASENGCVYLNFDREAESLETAIGTALQDIIRAGYEYDKILVRKRRSQR